MVKWIPRSSASGLFIFALNSSFQNNIFSSAQNFDNCILNNNIFYGTIHSSIIDDSVYSNNIINQTQNSIYVDVPAPVFNYNYNFSLKSTSPGVNAGTDGTDLGIYGGAYPWKEGSIPFNPHISIKQIAPVTDANGNLQITIKVQAQDN